MPYDGTIEIDEFRYMDTRDRPERDWRERDPPPRRAEPPVRINPLAEVVNNPRVTVTAAEVKAINDPKLMMTPRGEIIQRSSFQMWPMLKPKRTRKKTKTDKTMSSCLKQANAKGKLKNGKFRKGWDQSRIMTYAHKLCRKEMGTKKKMVRKTARRAYKR